MLLLSPPNRTNVLIARRSRALHGDNMNNGKTNKTADSHEIGSPVVVESPTSKSARGLTRKQRRFIDAYMGEAKGNGTMAATLAGYAGSYQTLSSVACGLLKNPNIQRAMAQVAEDDPLIATRCDRQRFWTQVMGDGEAEMKDRLKASELLGKTQADFVERREVVGSAAVEHRHQHRCEVDLSKATDEELAMLERTIRRLSS